VNKELTIAFKWLGRQTGSQVDRALYADIGLAVGEDCLTLLEDQEAKTVQTNLLASAHQLALWFAANWWRLRWEPANPNWSKDADWRIAHSMASAGGGYVWPNVIFASDGDSLAVVSRPRLKPAPYEPIRYLNRIDARITAAEFEQKVDAFITTVLSRLHSFAIQDDDLSQLWSEVLEERRDAEATQWRKLEALCGYDPDEAPAALVEMLISDSAHLGSHALEEVAAQGRHSTQEVLRQILALANATGKPKAGGFRGTVPVLTGAPTHHASDRPWQRATKLALHARQQWNLGKQPISNEKLAELLGTRAGVFTNPTKALSPMPIALRTGTGGNLDFYINKVHPNSRRFAFGRLLGDQLDFTNGGRLIPATDAATARQQFQRAFAQEFLCPFDALLEDINTDQPDDDDIQAAADLFMVSPRVVTTVLVNRGELEREALTWAD